MRTTRQNYIDSNFQAAREAGCDTIQLKYDGWWSRSAIEGGTAKVFTRTGRQLGDKITPQAIRQDVNATIIGELMYGTNWAQDPKILGKTFVFDVWQVDGLDLNDTPYRDRFGLLRAICKRLPPSYILVDNFPIMAFPEVWKRFVVEGDYEGVVFRHSKGLVETPIYRQKNVVVDKYLALDFEEGQGKFAGTLGAVVCATEDRPTEPRAKVGGGFTDEERENIWTHQYLRKGNWMEVEGRKKFVETGLLRHPNFVRWL